jgi:hypothetical protein
MYRVRYLQQMDTRLGRHVHHDPRSRAYPVRPRVSALASIRHVRHVPVFNQGHIGSCTGHAAVGCMGTGLFYGSLENAWVPQFFPYSEAGAVACYSRATVLDSYAGDYPPDDTGSDGLSVAKALQEKGEISGYEHAFGLDHGLLGLMERPAIVGVAWMNDMFDPDREGIVHPTGALAGGHEFVWDEYDAARGLVGFTNSWGLSWGKAGRFFMPAEEFGALLAQDGDVTSFVPIDDPAPLPIPIPPLPGRDDPGDMLWKLTDAWSAGHHTGGNRHAAHAVRDWAKATGRL